MPDMPHSPQTFENAFSELHPLAQLQSHPLTTAIVECFNWYAIFQKHAFTPDANFYVVAFRSVRKQEADDQLLYTVDSLAHEEAKKSGGLLMYWGGALNCKRECISTCVWESREAAENANMLPAHMQAIKLVREMYESFVLEKYWLTLTRNNVPVFELVGVKRWSSN